MSAWDYILYDMDMFLIMCINLHLPINHTYLDQGCCVKFTFVVFRAANT